MCDKLFLMGMEPNFFPFLSFITVHSSLSASPFSPLPNHINSLCLALSLSGPTSIPPTSLVLGPSSFPPPASLFRPLSCLSRSSPLTLGPVSCHLYAPPSLPPIATNSIPPPYPSSPVFRPSQMSDHSLVFRLPCHHIFHTSPSLNWACIIISYHVEYLITARDERWPPWTQPNIDRHRL